MSNILGNLKFNILNELDNLNEMQEVDQGSGLPRRYMVPAPGAEPYNLYPRWSQGGPRLSRRFCLQVSSYTGTHAGLMGSINSFGSSILKRMGEGEA